MVKQMIRIGVRDTNITRMVLGTGLSLWAVLSVFAIWPLQFPPLVDYPVHISLFQLSADVGRLESTCSAEMTTQWFTPYTLVYWVARWVVPWTSPDIFGKILLSIYLALTPLSFLLLLQTLKRPAHYALFIPMMLINFNFSWGFLPFLIAIPMIFLAVSFAVRASDHPSTQMYCAFSIILIVLFFTHLFAWMIAVLLCAAVIVITGFRGYWQRFWLLIVMNMPAGLLLLLWRRNLIFSQSDQVFLSKQLQIPSPILKLRFFSDYVISGDPGWNARYLFFATLGIAVMYLLFSTRLETGHPARFAIPVTAIVAYFLCPYSSLTAVWLFNRLAFFVAATCVLLLPAHVRFHSVFDSLLIALSIALILHMSGLYYRFDAESRPAFECMEHVPNNLRLACLIPESRSQFTDHSVYDHIDQYHQIKYGGCVWNPFAMLAHMPIRYKMNRISHNERFHILQQTGLSDDQYELFDQFLIRVPDRSRGHSVQAFFKQDVSGLELLYQSGNWMLLGKIKDSQ